jgi:DNA-binding HxlR family transcriptional regulator
MKTFLHIANCPIRDILSRLGDKWSLLVLATLNANGIMRFSDIHKSIGDVSQRMLTVTLRSLEADGLVSRKVYPEIPPRVEYSLTESGVELMPHLNNLVGWALKNTEDIMSSRQLYKGKSCTV